MENKVRKKFHEITHYRKSIFLRNISWPKSNLPPSNYLTPMVFAEYGDERLFIDRKGSCETEPSSSQQVHEEMDSDQNDMWQMSSTATILRRKGFLRVIRNIIFWRGVSVLQKEETSGYRWVLVSSHKELALCQMLSDTAKALERNSFTRHGDRATWCSGPGGHSTVNPPTPPLFCIYQCECGLLVSSIWLVLYNASFQRQRTGSPSRMHSLRVYCVCPKCPIRPGVPQMQIILLLVRCH